MKLKIKHLVIAAVLLGSYTTTPALKDHNVQIFKGQKTLDYLQDIEFINRCEYHDYLFFSFYTYKGAPVTFGIFENVHVIFYFLSSGMKNYKATNSGSNNINKESPPGKST